jgi:5-methylcytosine-specific restriction protein A
MPSLSLHPYSHGSCPELVTSNFCETYKRAREKARGTTKERGYGGDWERRRAAILKRDKGLCQERLRQGRVTPAKEVDHIAGRSNDPSNLRASASRATFRSRIEKESGSSDSNCRQRKICLILPRAAPIVSHRTPSFERRPYAKRCREMLRSFQGLCSSTRRSCNNVQLEHFASAESGCLPLRN